MKQSSFDAHDKEYRTISDISWHQQFYSENDKDNLFSKMGFEAIFTTSSKSIEIYIDVGCGAGYLLKKASDYFHVVYGIEPSLAAINTAKKLNDVHNIQYINMSMVDGLKFLSLKEPFLLTTSAVLSHIPDSYVVSFLKLLREHAPLNSQIYFYEPYGKNIQTNLWHVRGKKWWTANLDGWNVKFLDIKDSGYLKGIYAEKYVSSMVDTPSSVMLSEGYINDIFWNLSGFFYKIRYALTRLLRRK